MADWARRPSGVLSRALGAGDNWNAPQTFANTSGVAHTKGAWSQMIASCPIDADGFYVQLWNSTGSPQDWLIDIGIGASGSEVVLVPDLYLRSQQNDSMGEKIVSPMAIPAGARISGRGQGSSTAGAITGQVVPMKGGLAGVGGFQRCISAGVVSASSRGTQMTEDYGIGWALLRDNCPEMKGFVVSGWPAQAYSSNPDVGILDIGCALAGAGAATHMLLPGLVTRFPPNVQGNGCWSGWWPIRVPDGCSLWARANGLGYPGKAMNVAVYGFQ
jgi:hypothetical protein